MRAVRYALLHLARNIRTSITTLLSYLCVLAVIMTVQQSTVSRQNHLIGIAKALEIQGNITDASGYVANGLDIESEYALQFLDEDKLLTRYVEDVRVKGIFSGNILMHIPGSEPEKAEDYTLCVITTEKADDTLRFGDGMMYEEGIDNGIWMTDKPVCAVSSDLMHYSYIGEDGDRYLDMNVDYVPTIRVNTKTLDYSLRVIGTTEEVKEMVYVPFYTILNSTQEHDAAFKLDSLSFTVKDNEELDIVRNMVGTFFKDPKVTTSSDDYALVLKDAQYLKLTREAEKNLAVLQLMQPILYLCALGAGVMLVVMQMRSRKKEMAVIRSLGAGKLRVMAQSILEYALICLPVTLFALLVWRELSPMTVFGVWLAFMAGALCTIVRFSMIPLVKQIRELEE